MDAKKLRNALPSFAEFSSSHVSDYLNHYKINFVNTNHADTHIIGHFKSGAYTLVGQAFLKKCATKNALLIHGYMDHTGLYGHLIQYLLDHQYNVFICDLPGHGLSSGKQASIKHFFEYTDTIHAFMDLIQKQPCAALPWCLFGQSMGGAISMSLLKQQQLHFEKTVLFAPLIQPRHWHFLKHIHSLLKNILKHTPRSFIDNSHDQDFNRFLKDADTLQTHTIPVKWISAMREWRDWLLNQPCSDNIVLVIQGTSDTTIDWQYGNKAIAGLFSQLQLCIVKDARHHMINESAPYLEEILKHLGPFLKD